MVTPALGLRQRAFVTIGGGPLSLCSALGGEVILALASGGTQVSVLNGRTAEVRSAIEVGRAPWNALARGALAYIALHAKAPAACDDAVQVVDLENARLSAAIPLPSGSRPKSLVPAFDRERLYSLNSGNGTVSDIDLSRMQVTRTVDAGLGPHYGQRESGHLFVANGGSNDLVRIDEETFSVTSRVAVGRGPERCVVFKNRGQVYTNDLDDNTLTIVDTAEERIAATVPVEPGPIRLTPWDSRGRDEWAVLCRGDLSSGGSIMLVDSDSHLVTDTLRLPDEAANWNWGIAPRHQSVYVTLANEPALVVVDAVHMQVVERVALGAQPERAAHGPGIFVSGSGGVFVACEGGVAMLSIE